MTDAMTTLERVARAICAEEGIDPDCPFYRGIPWTMTGGYATCGDPHPYWTSKVPAAKAALQALRQVDDETVEAMRRTVGSMGDAGYSAAESMPAAFTAAIDHILQSEGPRT